MDPSSEPIILDFQDKFAIITLNIPKNDNAMTHELWVRLAELLRHVGSRDDIMVTIVTGTGRFFSSGADVKMITKTFSAPDHESPRANFMSRLATGNGEVARALYEHPKILVAALNGPAIGLSAALLGYFDFIYAVESAYIFTPFTALSLVAEGGASQTFPQRMGIKAAKEALLFGKKLGTAELMANGFLNKVFPATDQASFINDVVTYLQEKYSTLDSDSVLITKKLINATLPDPSGANIREVFAGVERFETGKPIEKFARLANKTLRHKL